MGTIVKFYEFTEPNIPTDFGGRAIELSPPFIGLAGVHCPVCGQTWATTLQRIRRELPLDHPLRHNSGKPITPAQLRAIQKDVQETLGLSPEDLLLPGCDIGLLHIECKRSGVHDFEWPGIHSIVITKPIRDLLEAERLTGWHAEPVVITKVRRGKTPELYEFVIDGQGGQPISNPVSQILSICAECGRIQYSPHSFGTIRVDLSEWDGSDFFRFAPPFHGRIFVTEAVRKALVAARVTNFETLPIASE